MSIQATASATGGSRAFLNGLMIGASASATSHATPVLLVSRLLQGTGSASAKATAWLWEQGHIFLQPAVQTGPTDAYVIEEDVLVMNRTTFTPMYLRDQAAQLQLQINALRAQRAVVVAKFNNANTAFSLGLSTLF